ncbi:glycosyltransferase family 2 protein [Halorubrum halophilum]|uniref:glycosyltransferase family 2 protein n=1 Tax=Halorubrum halophilum TaxID=413816 RepID=UPI000679C2D0|nr:glycosyltransferase family A protein [Halorubrum halophilum]
MNADRTDGLVSVVLPTYGRPEFLVDAVESVDSQSYGPIEIVVVDDHSPDPIEPRLEDVSVGENRTLRCIRHEENRGASAARSTGIEASEGEFIAFLDDDDYWLPSKVERQVKAFERAGSDVGVVYTGQQFVVDGEVTSVSRPTLEGDVTKDILCGATMSTFSAIMVRSEVYETVGGPDERFPCWQDREWLLRLSTEYDFAVVSESVVVRRSTDHEQISDDFETKRDTAYPLFLETFRPLAATYGQKYERRLVASQSLELGKSAVRHGYARDARKYLLRSIRYHPTEVSAYLYFIVALGGKSTIEPARAVYRSVNQLRE